MAKNVNLISNPFFRLMMMMIKCEIRFDSRFSLLYIDKPQIHTDDDDDLNIN